LNSGVAARARVTSRASSSACRGTLRTRSFGAALRFEFADSAILLAGAVTAHAVRIGAKSRLRLWRLRPRLHIRASGISMEQFNLEALPAMGQPLLANQRNCWQNPMVLSKMRSNAAWVP
jgi:hypothetical protein